MPAELLLGWSLSVLLEGCCGDASWGGLGGSISREGRSGSGEEVWLSVLGDGEGFANKAMVCRRRCVEAVYEQLCTTEDGGGGRSRG